jgi:hypothetical protein
MFRSFKNPTIIFSLVECCFKKFGKFYGLHATISIEKMNFCCLLGVLCLARKNKVVLQVEKNLVINCLALQIHIWRKFKTFI